MPQVHRLVVPGGAVELELEIGLSPDPRGGLFGYADEVDRLPRPLRDAVIGGAIDGALAGRERGALGVIDEVLLHAVRVEGAPDLVALREAVRALVAVGHAR